MGFIARSVGLQDFSPPVLVPKTFGDFSSGDQCDDTRMKMCRVNSVTQSEFVI